MSSVRHYHIFWGTFTLWVLFMCLVKDINFACPLMNIHMFVKGLSNVLGGHSDVPWGTFKCSLRDIYVSFEEHIYVPGGTSIIKVFLKDTLTNVIIFTFSGIFWLCTWCLFNLLNLSITVHFCSITKSNNLPNKTGL